MVRSIALVITRHLFHAPVGVDWSERFGEPEDMECGLAVDTVDTRLRAESVGVYGLEPVRLYGLRTGFVGRVDGLVGCIRFGLNTPLAA